MGPDPKDYPRIIGARAKFSKNASNARDDARAAMHADDPDAVQMLAPVDISRARAEHDAMVEAYRGQNVEVHFVDALPKTRTNKISRLELREWPPPAKPRKRPGTWQ